MQARAFLDVADLVLVEPAARSEAHVAAALAVLASIAAADSICGLRLGRYSRAQDHEQAVSLLSTASPNDATLVMKLRKVLAAKDAVHYSPRVVEAKDAGVLVRQARALVEAAESISW